MAFLYLQIAPPNIFSKVLSVVIGNNTNVCDTLPGATASLVPWRTTDPKDANHEIYVDLVEEMDAIISRSIFSHVPTLVEFITLIILLVHTNQLFLSCTLFVSTTFFYHR